MAPITQSDAPPASLIGDFAQAEAHYTDAFYVDVSAEVDLAHYVYGFYSTPLFRAERFILKLAARAPSSDADLAALAQGAGNRFAVWTVEARRADEILLGDASGRTKSWLWAEARDGATRLWFGSVVVPVMQRGRLVQGPVFDTLLGVHKLYSRLLLGSAVGKMTAVGFVSPL
ncbi:MAG: hypothetical protein AB8B71_13895 [Paracoccaceae bacterium]